MRILHVTYEYPGVTRNCGGGGRVTETLVDRLRVRGHTCRVRTDTRDGHWATFPFRTAPEIAREIERFGPDVVHGHFALPSAALLPWLTPTETPLVVTCMGADVYDPTRFRTIRPLADRAVGGILDRADAVVAPSTDLQQRIVEKWDADPERIPHGIRTEQWRWKPRQRPDSPTVVSVCRLVERKQLELGIEAVRRWRERSDTPATYRIIGTGPLEDHLREAYGHRDWLHIEGYVEDLQTALSDGDLFLLPSAHEAFGMAIAEALACGLPTVTTDTGGQTDLVADAVGATASPNADKLAGALATAHDRYAETQAATRGYVAEHFDAELMADRYEELYRAVTGDRHRAASQTPSASQPRPPSSSSSHRQA